MLLTEDQANRISSDGLIHDAERLQELRALPLHRKIGISAARISEWYQHYDGQVYVSFSGGKDSTVLLHMVRQLFPDVPAVFSNTGLEYPELRRFAEKFDNVITRYPRMNFVKVITSYGYPLISKEVAEAIHYARRIQPIEDKECRRRSDLLGIRTDTHTHTHHNEHPCESGLNSSAREMIHAEHVIKRAELLGLYQGGEQRENLQTSQRDAEEQSGGCGAGVVDPAEYGRRVYQRRAALTGFTPILSSTSAFNKKKWLPIAEELPVMISHYCCNVMKKGVMSRYQTQSKRKPFLGTLAEESRMRKQAWIRHGCNAFDSKKPTSQPMSFWTEQDVLMYIKLFDLEIAPPYGEVQIVDAKGNLVESEGAEMPEGCKLMCSGCERTGCIYCAFGAHLEKESRFKRLSQTHPRQYEYCMEGGMWIDNPKYDPHASMAPDEMGWVNWNPKQIWVPSKEGLGLRRVFEMCNEIIPGLYKDY